MYCILLVVVRVPNVMLKNQVIIWYLIRRFYIIVFLHRLHSVMFKKSSDLFAI
jgi:hypothetical protein